MCGIVGYVGEKEACPILINGLLSLEYRGYDSAGIAILNSKNKAEVYKSKGRVKELENLIKHKNTDGKIGIAHTRWATHGVPSDKNAHPHHDNFNEFFVVHNGIIENYDEVKKFLLDNGYKLYSETDTEVIPNLVHYFFHKEKLPILKAFAEALKKLEGSYAIEMIAPEFPDRIFIAKKDSPIVVGKGDKDNFIASDIPAIIKYTNKFYFINDFEIAEIYKDKIDFYDFNLKKINKDLADINYDAVSYDKNGYEDYMLKEIYDQPKAVRETIGTSFNKKEDKINLSLEKIDFSKFKKIYIVACGTAMHAGMSTKYAFEKFAKVDTIVEPASEFRYKNPLVDKKTLCIFISQSGETADTIAALKLAKEKGATTIAIVNVIGSSITRLADHVLYTHAGPEIAVASTKAYSCQVILLTILALYIGEKLGNVKDEEAIKLKGEMLELPKKITEVLESRKTVGRIAKEVHKKEDMYFIGRLSDYATALEGALKLKEVSYIHADAYPAGELKHGPIALIEKNVDVVGVATNKEIVAKTISNLEEVATRGANIILVTNVEESSEFSKIKDLIKIPKCDELISSILAVIPLQLLAYFVAKEKKLDVDKPRNLAKSVTVE